MPMKNETTSTHECTDSVRTLSLSWVQDVSTFNLSLAFNVNKKEKEWHLGRVDVDFDLDNGTFLNPEGNIKMLDSVIYNIEHCAPISETRGLGKLEIIGLYLFPISTVIITQEMFSLGLWDQFNFCIIE